jgi:response regulator RpfG family c-di-GMP phosphodiesterase
MPHLNGREFIAKLSEIGHKGSLPLIMVSGMISLKEINDIMGSGVEFFLPKPLNMNDFAHYVELYRQRYMLAQSVSTN